MRIEQWEIERLIPYARNPRVNDHAVDRFVSILKEYGFRVPIIAKSDGEVVDGHLRLKAARRLGIETVPVVLVDDLTTAQIKALRISLNKTAELAQWDGELLRLELDDIGELGFDLELTGFDEKEIDNILAEEERIKQKKEELRPIKWIRILLSIPAENEEPDELTDMLKKIVSLGGQVDYGGN